MGLLARLEVLMPNQKYNLYIYACLVFICIKSMQCNFFVVLYIVITIYLNNQVFYLNFQVFVCFSDFLLQFSCITIIQIDK